MKNIGNFRRFRLVSIFSALIFIFCFFHAVQANLKDVSNKNERICLNFAKNKSNKKLKNAKKFSNSIRRKKMATRKIVTNDMNFLRKKCKKVDSFDKNLANFIDDMINTLHSKEGAVGLAAIQVGILKRVVVIDIGEGVIELVNPEIVETKGEQEEMEGCLSFPGVYEKVKRPAYVKVKAFDRNGKVFYIEGKNLLARAFCHEIDHLDGVIFLDRIVKK